MLGRPMSRYIEGCLEKALEDGEPSAESFADWAASLPSVTDAALGDLRQVLDAKNFTSGSMMDTERAGGSDDGSTPN